MAEHRVTTAPHADPSVDDYLADLAVRLRGPEGVRSRILAELRDGLEDAIRASLARGMPQDAAAREAMKTFGSPEAVARSFAGELAIASSRRTLAAFLLTGPFVGIWWLLLLHPSPWPSGLVAVVAAIPALPLVALAVATAAGTFATTGRLIRWLPEATPGRALGAVTTVAILCLVGDITVLGVLAADVSTGRSLSAPLAPVAVAASLLRIGAALLTLRRCRAVHTDRHRWLTSPNGDGSDRT